MLSHLFGNDVVLFLDIFQSHPRLSSMLESGEEVAASGLFKPDVDDPDCCKALSSAVTSELSVLCKVLF